MNRSKMPGLSQRSSTGTTRSSGRSATTRSGSICTLLRGARCRRNGITAWWRMAVIVSPPPVGRGQVEDVAEQHQLVALAVRDARAEIGEAAALLGIAEHRRERALSEVQVADHEQCHSGSTLLRGPRRGRLIFPPKQAII